MSLWRHLANLHKFLYSFEKTIRNYLSMPNFKSLSFKMAVLQGGGQNLLPPPICVLSKRLFLFVMCCILVAAEVDVAGRYGTSMRTKLGPDTAC